MIYEDDINNCIGPEDLVINVEDENICSGGFCVKSIMLKSNISPIKTMNANNRDTEEFTKVSDMFDNLAVPNWSYSSNIMEDDSNDFYDDTNDYDNDYIDDDLYDKLLDLVEHIEKKNKHKHTRRKRENKQRRLTRRRTSL